MTRQAQATRPAQPAQPTNPTQPTRLVRLAQGLLDSRPPLGDRRFWVVQLLTVLINAVIGLLWGLSLQGLPSELGVPLVDVANLLFLIPVMYAALNFGLAGSVATAVFVALLRGAFLVVWHDPLQLWLLAAVYATVLAVAVVIGERVEREVAARRDAEAARAAAQAVAAQFRRLFQSSPAPTLLVEGDGTVRRANPTAATLFGRACAEMEGVPLEAVVGEEMASAVLARTERMLEHRPRTGAPRRFLRPVVSHQEGAPEGALQVVFLDVSEERRQLGIKDAYATFVLQAQEQERSRIAQEVHDEPLQRLVQLCHQLDGVSARAGSAALPTLTAARCTAEGVADELRRLAAGLRPPALDELGLAAAVRMVARDLGERVPGLRVRVFVRGPERRLDRLVELNLFRIAQEALRNVERHAGASRVTVTLAYRPGEVGLAIADDGRGLPGGGAEVPPAGRLGLVGMQERARLLGSQLRLTSPPGGGTRVHVAVRQV